MSERAAQTCPIKAQSGVVARATASICNAERACLGGQGGHGCLLRSGVGGSSPIPLTCFNGRDLGGRADTGTRPGVRDEATKPHHFAHFDAV